MKTHTQLIQHDVTSPFGDIEKLLFQDTLGHYTLVVTNESNTRELIPLETDQRPEAIRRSFLIMKIINDGKKPFDFIIEETTGPKSNIGREKKVTIHAPSLVNAKNRLTESVIGVSCRIIVEDQEEVALHAKYACFFTNGNPKPQFIWLQAKSSNHVREKFEQKFPYRTLIDPADMSDFGAKFIKYFPKN